MKVFYIFAFLGLLLFSGNSYSQTGVDCTTPHFVTILPFVQTGMTTAGSVNNYDGTACGSDYLSGEDYVFSFTPSANMMVNVNLTNTGPGVGLFVMDGCPDAAPACVAYAEGTAGSVSVSNVALTGAVTYYIIVSTYDFMGFNPNTAFDIEIYELIAQDGGVTSIITHESNCGLTNSETVTVLIANFGTDPLVGFDVAYSINGGPAVTETTALNIPTGGTDYYTFTACADLSTIGEYTIEAWTIVSGDPIFENDAAGKVVANAPEISTFPYTVDFESAPAYWSPAGEISTWDLGTPAATVINYAASGTNSWVTNLTGNHAANEVSYLVSPCFDFTSLSNPRIEFNLWHELTMILGSATMEYSTDMGMTWDTLAAGATSTNWYGMTGTWTGSSAGWLPVVNVVPDLAGYSSVKFRFALNGGMIANEGLAFDDFAVSDCNLPTPTADFSYVMDSTHVEFTSYTEDATYFSWDFGDFIGTSMEEHPVYDYMIPGTYTVTLIASNDCGSTTVSYTIEVTVGMDEISETKVTIYPNPVQNDLFVNIEESGNYRISDIKGSILLSGNLTSDQNRIDISNLENGVYFIRINSEKESIVKKIVKQ